MVIRIVTTDRYSDGTEVAAGTDPNDSTDHPGGGAAILGYDFIFLLGIGTIVVLITYLFFKRKLIINQKTYFSLIQKIHNKVFRIYIMEVYKNMDL